MRAEHPAAMLANMSAPPRSIVMLPRLEPPAEAAARSARGRADLTGGMQQEIRVGPGGGLLQSGALRIARINPMKTQPATTATHRNSLPRADSLALMRHLVGLTRKGADPVVPLRALQSLSEAALMKELNERLNAIPWPDWVPPVGFILTAQPPAEAEDDEEAAAPSLPGVCCPLLTARLLTACRGPVFLRDAAPAYSRLLSPSEGEVASSTLELWLPIRPGGVRPIGDGT